MIGVTKLWVRSFNLDHLDVFWEISAVRGPASDRDLTNHEIYDYEFVVLRSEAALGPYDTISPALRDQYRFRDTRVSLLHAWRQYFYKIRVTHKPSGAMVEFGPTASHEPEPDLIAAEIIRQEDMLFRKFVGRRCWLFPARTFGPRCSCWDLTLNRATTSSHLPCYGTGWLGGYYSPVEMFVQFDPSPKQVVTSPTGDMHPSNTSARTSSFPPVSPRDILIESENRRWRVVNVSQTQHLRATVHQELQLHEVPRGDVEYSIPLLVDAKTVEPASEQNYVNAQNIETDDPLADIFAFWGKARGTLR